MGHWGVQDGKKIEKDELLRFIRASRAEAIFFEAAAEDGFLLLLIGELRLNLVLNPKDVLGRT